VRCIMAFKIHLIIVSIVIVIIYVGWRIHVNSAVVPEAQTITKTSYNISVIHASWGLNCPLYVNDKANSLDQAYVQGKPNNSKPSADNVLKQVSELCNNEEKCSITASSDVFGDILPTDCAEPQLAVEYRCHAFDRPWRDQTTSGSLDIDCTQKYPSQ
jgi:hypothetical protein